jgi:DNA invertase Pin-like site-specific DNA recombinase
MNQASPSTAATRNVRCAVYARKSSEEGLEQAFNSLQAQREAAEAYIASQQHAGWRTLPQRYDDGGYSGGNMDRPALAQLLQDIQAKEIDCLVVHRVDRFSRSLLDFAKMMETLDKHQVAFVSVTQQFNTATSMGRLVLNILLSFAQFEREIIAERTRDKIAATRRKGKWCGGMPLLGYDVDPVTTKLVINEAEAERVRAIFRLYREHQALQPLLQELEGPQPRRPAIYQEHAAQALDELRLQRPGPLPHGDPCGRARTAGRHRLVERSAELGAKPPSCPTGAQEARCLACRAVALPAVRLCHDAQPHAQKVSALSLLRLLCRAEAWLAGLSVEGGPGGSDRTGCARADPRALPR